MTKMMFNKVKRKMTRNSYYTLILQFIKNICRITKGKTVPCRERDKAHGQPSRMYRNTNVLLVVFSLPDPHAHAPVYKIKHSERLWDLGSSHL